MKLDLKKGDAILTGKWQNKHDEVKSIGENELGQPTVNGKPMLKFRIVKLLPKESNEMKFIQPFETLNEAKETANSIIGSMSREELELAYFQALQLRCDEDDDRMAKQAKEDKQIVKRCLKQNLEGYRINEPK